MAADTATVPRADRARKYVELSALETVLNNVIGRFVDETEASPLNTLCVADLYLTDAHGEASSSTLFKEFYPSDVDDDTVEKLLLNAETEALAASILAVLASVEV